MEEEIGVRMSELLALPATPEPEPEEEPSDPGMTDPGYVPDPPALPAPSTPSIPYPSKGEPPPPTPVRPAVTHADTNVGAPTPAQRAARRAAYERWLAQLPKTSTFTRAEREYSAWWERYKAKHPGSDLI